MLFLSLNFGYSQTYDSIATKYYGNGDQLNQIDSLGNRQGLWINYSMFIYPKDSAISTVKPDTGFKKISRGSYLNDQRIGLWEFYDDHGCTRTTKRIIKYSKDGSVEETKYWRSTITRYSPDSSLVTSTVNFNEQIMIVNCHKKTECIATYKGKELKRFDYRYLDAIQFGFATGMYSRECKILDL